MKSSHKWVGSRSAHVAALQPTLPVNIDEHYPWIPKSLSGPGSCDFIRNSCQKLNTLKASRQRDHTSFWSRKSYAWLRWSSSGRARSADISNAGRFEAIKWRYHSFHFTERVLCDSDVVAHLCEGPLSQYLRKSYPEEATTVIGIPQSN